MIEEAPNSGRPTAGRYADLLTCGDGGRSERLEVFFTDYRGDATRHGHAAARD